MLKRLLVTTTLAASLSAAQYATLKDGRTIILHDNGTWEEVQVVQSSNPQVAAMAAKDLAGAAKAVSIEEPLARMLVGKWSSKDGSISYDFKNDGTVSYTIEGESKTERYTIQFIDSKDNTISVSIGDSSRYGKVVFGGNFRKFKIEKNGKKMIDYTDEITALKTVELVKIGEASESKAVVKSGAAKKIDETPSKNGFVK